MNVNCLCRRRHDGQCVHIYQHMYLLSVQSVTFNPCFFPSLSELSVFFRIVSIVSMLFPFRGFLSCEGL